MSKISNFEQMISDFDNGVYNFTSNGKCIGCGACCSNLLPMTKEEISRIKSYISRNGIKEKKHIPPLANPAIDMTCPFLDDSKSCEKCTIYAVRPMICRLFICDKSQRKDTPKNYLGKAVVVNVRSTFFGG